MTPANSKQVGGQHYKSLKMQPWDAVVGLGLDFFQGNILKYICRRKGNRIEDLEKAKHYIEKYIEVVREEGQNDTGRTGQGEGQDSVEVDGIDVLVLPGAERAGRSRP